jgi:hypothetical protein
MKLMRYYIKQVRLNLIIDEHEN